MAGGIATQCPKCSAVLTLKSRKAVGKKVPCPKCGQPFVVRPVERPAGSGAPPDAVEPIEDLNLAGEDFGAGKPPPVVSKRAPKGSRRKSKARREREEKQAQRFGLLRFVALFVCLNAHLAVAVCVIDSAIDFLQLIANWDEVYRSAGLGRFAVRQVGRPLFVIVTALIVWFQGVLSRDRFMSRSVMVFGVAYLFFFGLIAFIIGATAESIYERPIYAIQWSVIYMGVSLLAFSLWGYGPETTLQRAERLTSEGRYSEALTAVAAALREDPDDRDAYELERSLRDMLRFG